MYPAHLEKLCRTQLADVLIEEGVLTRDQVEDALAEQEGTGKQLGALLVEKQILTDYDVAKLVTARYALPYLDVGGYTTRREVIELLPLDMCLKCAILPLDQFGSILTIAISEMPEPEVIEKICELTKLTPSFFVSLRQPILTHLDEEKKRLASRNARGARAAAKTAAPDPAPVATATAAVAPTVPATAPVPVTPVAPAAPPAVDVLAELADLPIVSLKLVNAAGAKTPAPSKITAKASPARALKWMDAAGGPKSEPVEATAAKTAEAPPKTAEIPARPAAQQGGAWQSIFDAAESAVKKEREK
jgi:hypothetical protein